MLLVNCQLISLSTAADGSCTPVDPEILPAVLAQHWQQEQEEADDAQEETSDVTVMGLLDGTAHAQERTSAATVSG